MIKVGIVLLLTIYSFTAYAQNLIAIQHGSTITYHKSLAVAISKAKRGDAIYLPGGVVNGSEGVVLTKRLRIYGCGYNPLYTQATGTSVIDGHMAIWPGADSSFITGVRTNGSLWFRNGGAFASIKGVQITKSHFKKLVLWDQITVDSAYFSQNVFDGEISNSSGISFTALFENNFIGGALTLIAHCTFRNNIFLSRDNYCLTYGDVLDVFENNVFLRPKLGFVFAQTTLPTTNNIFRNNLFVNDSSIFNQAVDLGTDTMGIFSVPPASIFRAYASGSVWKPSYDFRLQPQSPGVGAGTDGTDIGIYGSSKPFQTGGIPANPHFEEIVVSGTASSDSSIRYSATVAGQHQLLTSYQYWFDDGDSTLTKVLLSPADTTVLVSRVTKVGLLDTGYHYFHIQFKDTSQLWSSVVTRKFRIMGKARLDFVTPSRGGNTGEVTMNVYGDGFYAGTQIDLVRGSDTIRIPNGTVHIYYGNQLSTIFDVSSMALGYYDVVVTIPYLDTVMVLPHSFEVVPGNYIPPYAEIIGPGAVRANWNNYSLVVTNSGNVNSYGTTVYLGFPADVEFEPEYPPNFYPTTSLSYDTINPYFEMDSLFGEPLHEPYRIYPILLPSVAPGAPVNLPIRVRSNHDFCIRYASSNDLYQLKRTQDRMNCLVNFFEEALDYGIGLIPVVGCVKTVYDYYINPTDDNCPIDFVCKNGYAYGIHATANVIADCATKPVRKVLEAVEGALSKSNAVLRIADGCMDAIYPQYPSGCFGVQILFSRDPNAKYGPPGLDTLHRYISGQQRLNYAIHFENDSTATAPAQVVLVTDTLDSDVYDFSSFSFGDFRIADAIVSAPPGLRNFKKDVDLNLSGIDVTCRFTADFDSSTGIVNVGYASLDPNTLQQVTNPSLGFLPPNRDTPKGQASFTFSVGLKASLTPQADVENKASIYFDSNPAIVTDTWHNTLDNIRPVSTVSALSPFQADTTFTVAWAASDLGAGLASTSIYYAVNGGPFILWKYNTKATSSVFVGNHDSTYCFYSVAKDSAMNIEMVPIVPDACTSVLTGSKKELTSASLHLFPNPTAGNVEFSFRGLTAQKSKLLVTDVLGEEIMREDIWLTEGLNRKVLMMASAKPGLYFIKLITKDGLTCRKMVKL